MVEDLLGLVVWIKVAAQHHKPTLEIINVDVHTLYKDGQKHSIF